MTFKEFFSTRFGINVDAEMNENVQATQEPETPPTTEPTQTVYSPKDNVEDLQAQLRVKEEEIQSLKQANAKLVEGTSLEDKPKQSLEEILYGLYGTKIVKENNNNGNNKVNNSMSITSGN